MEFINSPITMGVIVAVIISTSQFLKSYINAKWIPIINLVFGIIGCLFFTNFSIPLRILNGVLAGLTASGFYSSQKNIREGINGE